VKNKDCVVICFLCIHFAVQAEKKPKPHFIGFVCDKETNTLINAGAQLYKGKKGEFLRNAVNKFFEKPIKE